MSAAQIAYTELVEKQKAGVRVEVATNVDLKYRPGIDSCMSQPGRAPRVPLPVGAHTGRGHRICQKG